MGVLDKVPKHLCNEVELLITEDELDFHDKYALLKDIIEDPDLMFQILEIVITTKKDKGTPSSDDFLSLATKTNAEQRLLQLESDLKNVREIITNLSGILRTVPKLGGKDDRKLDDILRNQQNQVELERKVDKLTEQIQKLEAKILIFSGKSDDVAAMVAEMNKLEEHIRKLKASIKDIISAEMSEHKNNETVKPQSNEIPIQPIVKKNSIGDNRSPATATQPSPVAGRPLSSENRGKFTSRQPKTKATNILLLGETGVGKTTFINSLANYVTYATFEEALNGEPVVLVDATFTYTNELDKMITVEARANTGADYMLMKDNERSCEAGISSTQDPVNHLLKWVVDGKEKLVRIIDTPGINNTMGIEQDSKNIVSILKHISELDELHAICILMTSYEYQFAVGFRYCIQELLVKLYKNATKNIFFCFTKTKCTAYLPGESLRTLYEYLKILEKDLGMCIQLSSKNMFCYENNCFRSLCILRQLPPHMESKSDRDFISEDWLRNIRESNRMLEIVHGMSAHVDEKCQNECSSEVH